MGRRLGPRDARRARATARVDGACAAAGRAGLRAAASAHLGRTAARPSRSRSSRELVGDGIYITRLHYLGVVDPREGVITGMTRDGTFRIRDGKIAEPLVNLRFTVAVPEMLKDVPGLTRDGLAREHERLLRRPLSARRRSCPRSRPPGSTSAASARGRESRRVWRTTAEPSGRAARPDAASSVAPIATAMGTPCVLASERPPHPADEQHSAKPS